LLYVRVRWKSDEYKHDIGLEAGNNADALLADSAGHSSNNHCNSSLYTK